MIKNTLNILKSAGAFLQAGVAPPNTPPELQQQMENTNHFSSKKFFLAFSGFFILIGFYCISIALLFTLATQPALIPAYTTIFTKTMEVFATVMAVYLGGQAIVDLRYNSSSNASMSGEARTETVNITHTVIRAKEDDYTLEVE